MFMTEKITIHSEKDIEDLLQSGWIYVNIENEADYFLSSLFSKLPSDEIFNYGRGLFVKKSEKLYKRLTIIGMSEDSGAYDSCVIMYLKKDGKDVILNLLSLKESSNLEKIANAILNDSKKTKGE